MPRAAFAVPPLACAAMLAATALAARPLEAELPPQSESCWQRSYDGAHLKAHPRQKVTEIRLIQQDTAADARGGVFVILYFNLRQRTTSHRFDYQLSGLCRPRGSGLSCVPEWEAGRWQLERGPGGTLDIRNHGLTANPNPYDAEEIADGAVRIGPKPDDGLWRLSRLPGTCPLE